MINECDDATVSTIHDYVQYYGTQLSGAAIDDEKSDAQEQNQRHDEAHFNGLSHAHNRVVDAPFDVEFTRAMSLLLVPLDGEELPDLGHDGHYVVRCYPATGQKRTVVEREQNILSLEEARSREKEWSQAMLDELTRWFNLGAFARKPRKHATNVTDARWVLKWKEVNGKRIIQARLVVRGFKDLRRHSSARSLIPQHVGDRD